MQIDFPSGDITLVQLTGTWGKLNIFNIYNDCNHSNTIRALSKFHHKQMDLLEKASQGSAHTLWLGDFNRHHPHWDNHNDTRLFTRNNIKATKVLIEAMAEAGLELALLSEVPTHIHNTTKLWMRLDQVFISDHSADLITTCDTVTTERGMNTDHLPILTKINLATLIADESATHNFRDVDWPEFNKELERNLSEIGPAVTIQTQYHLNDAYNKLTKALQDTISKVVPISCICAKSKHWWTRELTMLHRQADKIRWKASKLSHLPYHHLHAEHTAAGKLYCDTLETTKRQHWRDWLERAEDPDIWMVNKLITSQPTDGGKSRIPTLTCASSDSVKRVTTNGEKSKELAKSFFLSKPHKFNQMDPSENDPCCMADSITKEQIERQLRRIKPYKAPGPDGIPNIILTKCADLLLDRLLQIYKAIYNKKLHYNPWKHFTTVVQYYASQANPATTSQKCTDQLRYLIQCGKCSQQ